MHPEGFERRFLRRLPQLQLAVLVPSLLLAVAAPRELDRILALGVALAWTFLLVPPTLACLIVAVMKGPRRVADSLPLPDSDRPAGEARRER